MNSFSNIVECLLYHRQDRPGKLLYNFLHSDGEVSEALTYQQLDKAAKIVAIRLQEQFLPGERALLLYPISLDYLVAFFGCLYAGVIPIPVMLPNGNNQAAIRHLAIIVNDAQATIFLTNTSTIQKVKFSLQELYCNKNSQIILTDQLGDSDDDWRMPQLRSDDIAFLQYTSGSTGNPKGVAVSHQNLIHNQRMIKRAFEHTSEITVVSWLPFYHDMGIIGNVIQPLYVGGSAVLMSPLSFLQQPTRWLSAISKYKNVTTGAPNFAYELCCNRVTDEQLKSIDLSGWSIAFNGAERISLSTMNKFHQKFSICGFEKSVFYPTYGLAEATLFVSGGLKNEEPKYLRVNKEAYEKNELKIEDSASSIELASSGKLWNDLEVKIVNSETKCIVTNGIGEIWLKGESIAKGYWNKPDLTKDKFNASIEPDKQGSFLRTGDLGYIYDQHLYIVGRLKDLIIIRGKNYYPEDIEANAQSVSSEVVRGGGAAFSIEENDNESLIFVQEIERSYIGKIDYSYLIEKIKASVLNDIGIQISKVVLLKPFYIPRTTSGKIKRSECRKLYLDSELACLTESSAKKGISSLLEGVES